MKRKSGLLLALCMLFSILAGCQGGGKTVSSSGGAGSGEGESKYKIAMVTDVAGLGDQSFNDMAYNGLKLLEADYGVEITVVESTEMTQYVTNLTKLADQGYDLIIAVGALLQDAVADAAIQRPDAHFLMVDTEAQGENVMSATYKEYEGSFLGGVAAGLMTKKNKVGFVGGMDIPPIERWRVGFEAGVKTVNPDCEVVTTYVEEFGNPTKGKQIALTQYDSGIDIIFAVAGQSGLGVIQAASDKGEGYYVVGSDSDQNHLAPKNVICSVVKRVDNSIIDAFKLFKDGKFAGGTNVQEGLSENVMGLSDTSKTTLPDDVYQKTEEWKQKIASGEFKVPANQEELDAFTPPAE